MSKELSPLKALKDLCENCHKHIQSQPSKGYLPFKECPYRHISNDYCEEYEAVEKSLKALEIIKEKQVNVGALSVFDTLEQYNHFCKMFENLIELTQQEYDLLKEVLL